MLFPAVVETGGVRCTADRSDWFSGHGDLVAAAGMKCPCGGAVCSAAQFRKMVLCWVCYRLHVSAIGQLEFERQTNRWADLEEPT